MEVEWRKIDDSYEASNTGLIRYASTGIILDVFECGGRAGDRYDAVYLTEPVSGVRYCHRLVCRAFHGEAPAGKPFVDHIDRNRKNNNVTNLRWVSRSENACNRSYRTTPQANATFPHPYIHHSVYHSKKKGPTDYYTVGFNRAGVSISRNFKKLEDAIAFRDSEIARLSSLTPIAS